MAEDDSSVKTRRRSAIVIVLPSEGREAPTSITLKSESDAWRPEGDQPSVQRFLTLSDDSCERLPDFGSWIVKRELKVG